MGEKWPNGPTACRKCVWMNETMDFDGKHLCIHDKNEIYGEGTEKQKNSYKARDKRRKGANSTRFVKSTQSTPTTQLASVPTAAVGEAALPEESSQSIRQSDVGLVLQNEASGTHPALAPPLIPTQQAADGPGTSNWGSEVPRKPHSHQAYSRDEPVGKQPDSVTHSQYGSHVQDPMYQENSNLREGPSSSSGEQQQERAKLWTERDPRALNIMGSREIGEWSAYEPQSLDIGPYAEASAMSTDYLTLEIAARQSQQTPMDEPLIDPALFGESSRPPDQWTDFDPGSIEFAAFQPPFAGASLGHHNVPSHALSSGHPQQVTAAIQAPTGTSDLPPVASWGTVHSDHSPARADEGYVDPSLLPYDPSGYPYYPPDLL